VRRFLIGLAGGFVLGYAARRGYEVLRDRRSPAPQLPADAPAYGRLRRQLMLAGMARSLATLGVLAYGLGPALEPPVENHVRLRRLARLSAGLALTTLVELPSEYVESYLLERRYGLSKQSAGDWALDQLKAFGVSLAVAVPLLELLASAIERAPRSWPAYATAGAFPLLLLANVVAPNYIAPMFNDFEPVDGSLERRLRALAARYRAGDAQILRVDMSRQTEKANAYVTGLFGSHRIVIGDTLISRFPEPAVEFVVAHELGHYVSGDVWRSVVLGTGAAGAIFFGTQALADRGVRPLSSATGIARLLFVASILGMAAGPLLAAFSRARERAADRFALEATSDASAGIAAFNQLREQNLAEEEQPRWMELLFSSHPSLRRRIESLENYATP
jgi:Zn-dependent protease with chaperone function